MVEQPIEVDVQIGGQDLALSPAFDLNPNPEGAAKQLATAIDERNPEASLATALEVAGLFRLSEAEARQIVDELSTATARWQEVARAMGLATPELQRLAPAFEHAQQIAARRFVGTQS
jgi:serine/threonine-protein kinase HipA